MAFNFNWFGLKKSRDQQIESPRRGFSYNNGNYVTEETSMKVSALYRGVIYISSQVAKLPWNVRDIDENIQVNSPINYLLNVRPNSEMNSMFFRLTILQDAILKGNGYAEIERDVIGRPIALWPIPFNYVQPVRTTSGKLVYRILNAGAETYIPKEDMFHVKNFHTKDGIIGQGLVAYAIDTLGIAQGANMMAAGLFNNSGMPSGILQMEGTMSDEAFERVKKDWKDNVGGKKSGGVAILENGLKFSAMSMSPDILQFLESRKFSVLEVGRFLGLPPTKLYDIDANSYNTQEQSNLEVATDTLDAWCRNLDGETDIKLLNGQYGGKKSVIDLYELFRGDMKTRSEYFSKMMQVAAITPNQIRKKEGQPPYEGGDRYYVAVNNYSPADRIDDIVDAEIKSKTTPAAKPAPAPKAEISPLEKAAIDFLEKEK